MFRFICIDTLLQTGNCRGVPPFPTRFRIETRLFPALDSASCSNSFFNVWYFASYRPVFNAEYLTEVEEFYGSILNMSIFISLVDIKFVIEWYVCLRFVEILEVILL